jgi:hypothetical protein
VDLVNEALFFALWRLYSHAGHLACILDSDPFIDVQLLLQQKSLGVRREWDGTLRRASIVCQGPTDDELEARILLVPNNKRCELRGLLSDSLGTKGAPSSRMIVQVEVE